MKRKAPNTTIEEFFNAPFKKSPIPVKVLSKEKNNNLVIVKSTPQRKVKCITIPSLSDSGTVGDGEFDAIWDKLDKSIDALFAGKFSQLNFTRLHNSVEFFCRLKSAKVLYDKLIEKINKVIEIH